MPNTAMDRRHAGRSRVLRGATIELRPGRLARSTRQAESRGAWSSRKRPDRQLMTVSVILYICR
jgi:hypothetical protein